MYTALVSPPCALSRAALAGRMIGVMPLAPRLVARFAAV
jgi:hypothetical protein